jgi:hypothetical protein
MKPYSLKPYKITLFGFLLIAYYILFALYLLPVSSGDAGLLAMVAALAIGVILLAHAYEQPA